MAAQDCGEAQQDMNEWQEVRYWAFADRSSEVCPSAQLSTTRAVN